MSSTANAMTAAPVAPYQPQPQGRRRYDATDIALLIEFSQIWMETEDTNEDDDIIGMETFANATVTTDTQVTTQDNNNNDGVVDLTMEEEPITTSSSMTMAPRDAASVVSVESFQCEEMTNMDEEKEEGGQESPKEKDGNYRESFMSTCWEIDSFMENVQVGRA